MSEIKLKVDLGCGESKREGFIGVDIAPLPGVDIVHDLAITPWPLEADTVEEVFCSHYLEHVHDLMKFFNELYRVMRVGGKASFVVPYGDNVRAWQDPTHVRPIYEASFLYYDENWMRANKLKHYPIHCNFERISTGYSMMPAWADRSKEAQEFALNCYNNVASDMFVTIVKRERLAVPG